MIDVLSILQQLKGWTPLATVFGLIIIGSYFRVWLWYRQYEDMKADYERRIQKLEESNEKLWALALRTTGLAELKDTVLVAKRQAE